MILPQYDGMARPLRRARVLPGRVADIAASPAGFFNAPPKGFGLSVGKNRLTRWPTAGSFRSGKHVAFLHLGTYSHRYQTSLATSKGEI